MNQLNKDEPIMADVLGRICIVLNCKVEDIMDFVPDSQTYEDKKCKHSNASNI